MQGFESKARKNRGIVSIGSMVIYPSPEGLAAVSASGETKILTADIMTKQDWQERYFPTTICGYYWEAKYIGFYTNAQGVGAGFIYDLKTNDLIDLNFYATAGWHEDFTGILYLIIDGEVVEFNGGV